MIISIIIVAVVIAVAAGITTYNIVKSNQTIDSINKMLDLAINDNFKEETFDESKMSALETKFANYLSTSVVSSRNVKQEKDKIKSLIADISHQTKTPIANLSLYCELLEEQKLDSEAAEYVEAIHGQTQKLRFLIDSLVKLSRLENGILVLSPRQEQLYPLLQRVVEDYQAKADNKRLRLSLKETAAVVKMDAKWTLEAISNIVDNAIKYTNEGEISIEVVPYELFTKVDIKDTGIGISEEEQTKIFSRFYRSEKSNGQEGVGIGLFLAREIVKSEGGYIRVSSKPGAGSIFSVFLPN